MESDKPRLLAPAEATREHKYDMINGDSLQDDGLSQTEVDEILARLLFTKKVEERKTFLFFVRLFWLKAKKINKPSGSTIRFRVG